MHKACLMNWWKVLLLILVKNIAARNLHSLMGMCLGGNLPIVLIITAMIIIIIIMSFNAILLHDRRRTNGRSNFFALHNVIFLKSLGIIDTEGTKYLKK